MSIIHLIRRDVRVRRLAKSFDSLPFFNLPVDTLLDEIRVMHETRRVRNLRTSSNFVDDIIQANLQDITYRSRLVEIMMKARASQRKLEQALDPLVEYILVEYSTELNAVRTKEERKQTIHISLEKFYRYISRVESLFEQAEMVVFDIDKASYGLKLVVETLKITSQKENYV